MGFKIGPPQFRMPVMPVAQPPPTPRMPQQGPNGTDLFTPFKPAVMSIPQAPAAAPREPVQVLRDAFERYKDLPGLRAGVSEEQRKAAVDVVRDAAIADLNAMGIRAQKHVKANGQF